MRRTVGKRLARSAAAIARHLRRTETGLTTLEYVIGAGVILVILAAAIVAWNTGLAQRIGELVQQLLSG
jgi:Flp pilus assembly pilin Flp